MSAPAITDAVLFPVFEWQIFGCNKNKRQFPRTQRSAQLRLHHIPHVLFPLFLLSALDQLSLPFVTRLTSGFTSAEETHWRGLTSVSAHHLDRNSLTRDDNYTFVRRAISPVLSEGNTATAHEARAEGLEVWSCPHVSVGEICHKTVTVHIKNSSTERN